MIRLAILAAALACVPAPACAQEAIPNGMVSDGFTFNNGFWWQSGRAFTRRAERFCTPTGCGYKWAYKPAVVQQAAGVTIVNNLIGIPVPVAYQQPIAQQGTTTYGYTTAPAQVLADPLHYLKLYQQSASLAAGAQALASDATAGHISLVQEVGSQQARVAEIIAQGNAAAQALSAAKPAGGPAQLRTQTLAFSLKQGADGAWALESGSGKPAAQAAPPAPGQVDSVGLGAALTAAGCVACHSGPEAKGKLNLASLADLTLPQATAIVERITTCDPAKRMPPPDSGKTLAPKALQAILNALLE